MVKRDPKTAKKLVELGDKEAAAGRLDEALAAYQQAARYAPDDEAIVERFAALRSKLVREHVEAAERAALEGHMDKAGEELAVALEIDPGNAIVAERMAQMKGMADEPLEKVDTQPEGLAKLQPGSGKRNIDLRGDTKTAYEQVSLAFGIKASFDPDLTAKSVRLRLGEVDFPTAMTILGTETGTFWRPVNAKLIFVAQDNAEKRRQYAPEAEQTFTLPESVAAEDMTELLRVIRDITGVTHIALDAATRKITLRASPEKLTLTREIIRGIEQARGEVMLEIELLEVDANKARQLGIMPPTSTQLIPLSTSDLNALKSSTDLTNLLTNLSQVLTAKGIANTTSLLPFGGGLSTFLLTIPGTAANFSDTLSLVHSGRQVLLRAQDGKPATFFVGDRFPVTLSLLSASLGTSSSIANIAALAGTTFPETSFTVGKNPSALVANNFTGGALPDIAAANKTDNTLTVLQNQDNGNFVQLSTSPITLSAGETGPVALGTGILRSDTTKFFTQQPPDLVVVNSTSNNISILLGNANANGVATGAFTEAPGSPIAVGSNPSSVVVADFNGDGFLDIAVANKGDNSISLFEGNGDGTFKAFPGSPFLLTNTSTISEKGPIAMVSANIENKTITNGNGGPEVDLAVVNQTSNNVSILLSSVDANKNVILSEPSGSPIAVGNSPVAIATGDMNADGVADLAVVNQGDSSITILLGSSNLDGTFSAAQGSPLQTGATPAGIVIANFANGAVPDLAVTNFGVNTLGVYIGQGSGTFAPRIEINAPTGPTAEITSVLSTSGLPDVALVAQDPAASKGVVGIILDSSNFASAVGTGSGGTAQQPYPASEYIDLGVKVKATPTLHPNHEVTLQMEFEIRALAGTNINGIPILSNRTLTETVRVREDQPSLLAGLTDKEESKTITGLPGFANLPGIGYAFGTRSNSLADTELLFIVTPRRLRFPERSARAISAGRGDTSPASGAGAPPPERPSERGAPPAAQPVAPTPAPAPAPAPGQPTGPAPGSGPPPNPPPQP